ncbi:hypothetical protein ACQEU3_14560 [Spirillospora sp. CA-253888]
MDDSWGVAEQLRVLGNIHLTRMGIKVINVTERFASGVKLMKPGQQVVSVEHKFLKQLRKLIGRGPKR